MSEKSKDSAKGIKILFTQVIMENPAEKEKEFNIRMSEAYRTLNSHDLKKHSRF